MIRDYTSGPILKQLISFATPLLLANLLNSAYNIVDMAVVGNFCGSVGLAGVSSGADIMLMFNFVGLGISMAAQILVAQFVGRGEYSGLNRMIGTTFSVTSICALMLTALGFLIDDWLLVALNVPPEALDDAKSYCLICYSGLIFCFLFLSISSVLRGMGDSKRPLVFIAVSAVINVILDYIFVANGMGPSGAALATVLAQAISCFISLIYLYKKRRQFGFDFRLRSFIPHSAELKMLVTQGIPLIIQNTAISVSSLYVASLVNVYGVTAVAVTGVAHKLNSIIMIVSIAMSTGGSAMVGQNFAAKKFDRVKSILFLISFISISFSLLGCVVLLAFPDTVFGIFDKSADVLELGRTYALIGALNFLAIGMRTVVGATTNGIGFAKMNMFLGLLDGIVMRIGLTLLFGKVFEMGLYGYWLGSILAGFTFCVVGFPYIFSGKWKSFVPPVERHAAPIAPAVIDSEQSD